MRIWNKRERRLVMDGFMSVWMYAGAFIIGAPLWMKDWDRPMRNLLKIKLEEDQ